MVLQLKRLLIAVALVFVASPLFADTLVLFKNGKAMRVKSVTKEGQWLKCEFEDKNFISVPAAGVLRVEEAALGGTAGELRPNQVAVGSGGGYVPGPRGGSEPAPMIEPPVEEDPGTTAGDQEDFLRQQTAVGRTNFRGIPIPPGQNPGVQQGLQQLNQAGTPFQNRRLNEQRGSNRNRIPLPPNQQPSAPDE